MARLTAVLALLLAAGPVVGQEDSPYQEPAEAAGPAMSLEDARLNFAAIVDAFVTKNSPEGYWPLKEKTSGQVLRLVPLSKDPKSIKDSASNPGHFSGIVLFRDQRNGDTVKTEFLIDFSGSEWKVKSMKILGKTPAKKKAA